MFTLYDGIFTVVVALLVARLGGSYIARDIRVASVRAEWNALHSQDARRPGETTEEWATRILQR